MSRKLSKKERFLRLINRDKHYRGDRDYTISLYKRFLKIYKQKGSCSSTDLFIYSSVRKKEFFISRGYEELEAKKKVQSIQSRGFNNRDYEKVIKSNEKRKKTLSAKTLEEIQEINRKKSKGYSPEYISEKYNITIGEAIERIEKRKQKKVESYKRFLDNNGGYKKEWSCRCAEFWAKRGYSNEEIEDALKYKFDTRSIESLCIRYNISEQEAIKKQKEIAEKCRNTFSQRPEHEQKEIIISRTKNFKRYSLKSYNFFEELNCRLLDQQYNVTLLYGDSEYFLWDMCEDNKKIYFYDCTIPEINLIIEYNGIIFHPREKDTWACTVEESVNKDNRKKIIAEKNNYEVVYVWEDEEKNIALERIVNIIKQRYDNQTNQD